MIVEIKSCEITNEEIKFEAVSLESVLTSEDLFESIDEEVLEFVFEKTNTSARKYLFKICQSQKKCQNKKSLGEMLEALPGSILSLSESFIRR